jgi:hypothetical protein
MAVRVRDIPASPQHSLIQIPQEIEKILRAADPLLQNVVPESRAKGEVIPREGLPTIRELRSIGLPCGVSGDVIRGALDRHLRLVDTKVDHNDDNV